VITRGLGARRVPTVTRENRRLVRDYQMERGIRDRTGLGPDLEPLGGEVRNGLYLFGPGEGVELPHAGVTDHYALQIIFRKLDEESGYRKIVDFKDRKQDGGVYLYGGQITFYSLANGGTPLPGQEHRLRLERNRYTRIVRAYLDWRPIFAFIDLDDDAVFENGKGVLFADDKATSHKEQGPGALRSLLVWGSPLAR